MIDGKILLFVKIEIIWGLNIDYWRVGPENHKPLPTLEEREELLVPLIAVASAQIKNGHATGYDINEIVKSDHYHYYANMS